MTWAWLGHALDPAPTSPVLPSVKSKCISGFSGPTLWEAPEAWSWQSGKETISYAKTWRPFNHLVKLLDHLLCISSVQFNNSVMSDSLQPHGLQHARPPCPWPTPRVYSNSCPLSRWCHSTISSSVVPFSSCLQAFPASGSFQMSQFFTSGGQSIRVSASVFPMNIQGWFLLGLTNLSSLQSQGLSRVFSNTTVQKHPFFGAQLSLWSNSHIHTWLLEKP